MNDGEILVKEGNSGSRKKAKIKNKRARQKEIRYADHYPIAEKFNRPCNHNTNKFKCNLICQEAIIQARAKLYKVPNRIIQNNSISHLLMVKYPKNNKSYKRVQSVRVNYKFLDKDKNLQPVCQKFFCNAFTLTQRLLLTISKFMQQGEEIKENRGGDHRSKVYREKKNAVIEFIGNLKGKESHYNRRKSERIYLASELNVTKLYRMYNSSAPSRLQVKKTFFAQIFATKFNIGFGTPATDVCSFCYQLKNRIKLAKSEREKSNFMIKRTMHKKSAKQFHLMMNKGPENCLSFCFDLQQVQVLPKVPIQEAFYATQLALYNFCITDLQTRTPKFYTWLETQAGRGSIEIGSSLYDFLNKVNWIENCKILRLFCDGCSGQNKNSVVISMLMFWLYNKAPKSLKTIIIVFPVRGHSFLPADRVFGRIEKITRRRTNILKKEDYWQIFSEVGEVRCLGQDWNLFNMKALGNSLKKIEGFRDAKRIYLEKDDRQKNNVKLEKTLKNIKLQEVALGRSVKQKKPKDVDNLLEKCYSSVDENQIKRNWREVDELKWYKELIDNVNIESNHTNDDEYCDCAEEDDRLHI
ncbi:hypothetical protein CBL_20445 [Carabus blaptoides fortunei]